MTIAASIQFTREMAFDAANHLCEKNMNGQVCCFAGELVKDRDYVFRLLWCMESDTLHIITKQMYQVHQSFPYN